MASREVSWDVLDTDASISKSETIFRDDESFKLLYFTTFDFCEYCLRLRGRIIRMQHMSLVATVWSRFE